MTPGRLTRGSDQGLGLEHPVHGEPAHEGLEPAGAGRFLGVHAEAVTTLFIQVELGRLLGRTPAVDQPETAIAEEGIVGGERDEQRRSVGRDGHRSQRTVDVADERRLGVLPDQRGRHGQHRAGRKTDHADAVRIDLPLGGAAPDQGEGGARVRDLRREASHHLLRVGARRPARGARKHLGHRTFESGHVRRGLVQPVLEDECRNATLGQRAGDIPAFVLHRQGSETAAWSNDDGGAAGLGRIGQERRDRRYRDVTSELAAVLGVPRFWSLRAGERAGADLDRIRLIGDGDRRHLVVCLAKDRRRECTGHRQNGRPERAPPCRNECRTHHHSLLDSLLSTRRFAPEARGLSHTRDPRGRYRHRLSLNTGILRRRGAPVSRSLSRPAGARLTLRAKRLRARR